MKAMSNNILFFKRKNFAIITPISLICSVFSIIICFTIAWLTRSEELYQPIMVLPISYSVASILAGSLYRNLFKSAVSTFIIGGYFARMVIQPFLFCLGGYVSFYSNVVTENNLIQAVLLLSLENLAVFLIANHYSKHFVYDKNYINKNIEAKLNNDKFLQYLLILIALFLLFAYYFVPELQTIYILLPTANFSELASIRWDNEMLVERGSASRYIYSMFMFLWPILRAILPAFCIFQIYKKLGNRRKAIYLSMLCLLIPSIFLGGDNLAPFMGAVFGILVMNRLFGNKTRVVTIVSLAIVSTVFVTVLISKMILFQNWRGAQGLASVSQILNAYLPGFENMAVAYSIYDPNKFNTLFYDIYYAIPFKETIFGFKGENLTSLYTIASSTGAQIVPWGYQLAHYFTMVGSAIVTSFFISTAYKNEITSKITGNFFEYYKSMYLSVLISISITIYSFSIFLRGYICVLLPVIFITNISKFSLKTNAKNI